MVRETELLCGGRRVRNARMSKAGPVSVWIQVDIKERRVYRRREETIADAVESVKACAVEKSSCEGTNRSV